MKKLLILFLAFSFFMCYSQEKGLEHRRKERVAPFFNPILPIKYGMGYAMLEKKGEYHINASLIDFFWGGDFYLGYEDEEERKRYYFLTIGISLMAAHGNSANKYIGNLFLEIPVMLKMEYDYGDISIRNSLGLYAAALGHTLVKDENQKILYKEDFPGYNFGIIFSLFGISYKFTETKAITLDFIARGDLTQAYYKGSKVVRTGTVSFNLGFEL